MAVYTEVALAARDDVVTQWRLRGYISKHVQVSGTNEAEVIRCVCVCHYVEDEVCSK